MTLMKPRRRPRPSPGLPFVSPARRQWPLLADTVAKLTDMSEDHADTGDRSPRVPAARRPECEIGIRELRDAGRVAAELAGAGAVGRVTSGGRLVGWMVPAISAERRADEL